MGTSDISPDRSRLLASIRDYLDQLREEGLEGVPAPVKAKAISEPSAVAMTATPKAPAVALTRSETAAATAAPASSSASAPAPGASADQPYRYPGLEQTEDLEATRAFIGECTRCKLHPFRHNIVFGVGDPHADLMFVGEAPGADEDMRGEPFVGRAGQLLTDIIERGMGITRADVYICNVIKCRPPENRNPETDEVMSCEPFLFRQIDQVRPRAIVGLGTFAVQALLKVKTPISKLRGNWQDFRGIKLMPTFHPAYLLRNPADKRLVWADIQEVMKLLGMAIPQRGPRR
jgi:uracil-DNA glycosylase